MTPPAATATVRSRSRARSRTVWRRRIVLLMIALGLAVTVFLMAPLFRRAYDDLSLPLSYANIIRQQSAEKNLDPALVAGLIYTETKFDSRPSAAGAVGLTQMLPQTAEFLARLSGATNFHVSDLQKPDVSIAYGSFYLRYLLNKYHNSEVLALAAYNGGETNVDRWLAEDRQAGKPFTVSEIPFPQTQAYVIKVMQAQRDYRATYASQLGYGGS
jgi:soluble lytic murein transglycosylase